MKQSIQDRFSLTPRLIPPTFHCMLTCTQAYCWGGCLSKAKVKTSPQSPGPATPVDPAAATAHPFEGAILHTTLSAIKLGMAPLTSGVQQLDTAARKLHKKQKHLLKDVEVLKNLLGILDNVNRGARMEATIAAEDAAAAKQEERLTAAVAADEAKIAASAAASNAAAVASASVAKALETASAAVAEAQQTERDCATEAYKTALGVAEAAETLESEWTAKVVAKQAEVYSKLTHFTLLAEGAKVGAGTVSTWLAGLIAVMQDIATEKADGADLHAVTTPSEGGSGGSVCALMPSGTWGTSFTHHGSNGEIMPLKNIGIKNPCLQTGKLHYKSVVLTCIAGLTILVK